MERVNAKVQAPGIEKNEISIIEYVRFTGWRGSHLTLVKDCSKKIKIKKEKNKRKKHGTRQAFASAGPAGNYLLGRSHFGWSAAPVVFPSFEMFLTCDTPEARADGVRSLAKVCSSGVVLHLSVDLIL